MLLIVLLSAAFIKSPFCGFVNQFQYVTTGVLSQLLWNAPSLLMLLQMLVLYPLTLERDLFSRGVWVCFSILFSESTQLLKTCLNVESETHGVFQLLEFVKRLEGRPETENMGCPFCTCRAEHWGFELLTTLRLGGFPVYS